MGTSVAEPEVKEGPRILIAEDEPDMIEVILSLVEAACPDAVIEAVSDGRRALARLGEFRPDLLLSDLMLPTCDGYSLCDAVRSNAALADTRVIVLTAYGGPQARSYFAETGVRYFEKPFDAAPLRRCILELLDGAGPSPMHPRVWEDDFPTRMRDDD